MYADFVDDVLLPLVEGKTMVVRQPLDSDDVETLVADGGSVSVASPAAFVAARHRISSYFLYDAPPQLIDRDAIRLGAAIHNLCWLLASPRREETRGAIARVAAYSQKLATLPPPADEDALVARHAIVGGVSSLTRKDVRVRFWAGEQMFLGTTPPRRLLRWQSVRRVREEHTTVQLFDEARESAHGKAIVVALLGSSPLSDLLLVDGRPGPFDLRRAAPWLASPRIARVLADAYLTRGLPAIEGPLVLALMSLYAQSGVETEAKIATSFHSHLHLLDVLTRPPRDREGHLQVLRGYLQGRDRSVADGFGLHAAAERIGLGRPFDVRSDALLERNVVAYGEACAELIGARRLSELTSLLVRGAGGHELPAHVLP